jgi:membrane protein implicated in regulation of membrane protease activity
MTPEALFMRNRDRPWTAWGLAAAALLALTYFGGGYLRARSLAASGPGGHWEGIAWLMLAFAVVSLLLLMLAVRRLCRAAPARDDGSAV